MIDFSGSCQNPTFIFLQCSNCDKTYEMSVGCGKRFSDFCPSCAKKWRNSVQNRYMSAIMKMNSPRLLTLTLRKGKGSMTKRLKSLWEMRKRYFKYLKRDTEDRRRYEIRAWCGVVEPPNHIHLIIDSEYIPQPVLSRVWEMVTGDSFVVDIRKDLNPKRDPSKMARYLAKYLGKASKFDDINLNALYGFHLCGSWGCKFSKFAWECTMCGAIDSFYRISEEMFFTQSQYYSKQFEFLDI